ncbi:UDP-N-acetylmuramate--alanine ligase, partial [Candidatus Hakubella thermalkaliphila]
KIAVITNIDEDHLDHFRNIEEIRELFRRYIVSLPDDGLVVACGDCPTLGSLVREVGRRCITYGLQDGNRVRAEDIVLFEFGSKFRVTLNGQDICQITLNVPGVHNIYNALAALSVANHLQLPLERVSAILANFCGAQRRFELKGKANGIMVVDDYAHHPTEIRATLAAARTGAFKRVVSVFQPHRYSRTKKLANSFGQSFGDSDLTIITDVYGAGEDPVPGVSGKTILDSLLSFSPRAQVAYLPRTRTIVDYLLESVEDGDLILTMGAGDIWTVAEEIITISTSSRFWA